MNLNISSVSIGIGLLSVGAIAGLSTVPIPGAKPCTSVKAVPAKQPTSTAQVVSYDWEGSTQKLQRIGAAIQLYRNAHGVLPVQERRTWQDAGLPPALYVALKVPGKPWTVADDNWYTSGVYGRPRHSNDPEKLKGSAFWFVYKDPSVRPDILAHRGESMPLLLDVTMYNHNQRWAPGEREVLILRLDGSVDRVNIDLTDVKDLVENR